MGAADDFFNIPLLGSCQFIIEDNILNIILFTVCFYFFKLSGSDLCCLEGTVQPLDEFFISYSSGCLGKKL